MTDTNDPPDGDGGPKRKPRSKIRRPDLPYDVGKWKPPVEHQFRKGGKAGPGRPKGSQNRSDFDKLLEQRIVVGEDRGGRPIRKTWRQIMNLQLMQQAAKGELAAIKIAKDFELKLETVKARHGEAPPSVEDVLKQAKEDEERRVASEKFSRMIGEYLDMMAELKHRRMLGPNGWSKTAKMAFRMIERGEIRDPDDDGEDDAEGIDQ